MKVGVISDTHLTSCDERLTRLLKEHFGDVDLILHAGDLIDMRVLDAFTGKDVKAVCGNMDSPAVRRQLPTRHTLQVGKFKIGLIHGWGGPQGIEERIRREFDEVDCIVYGHTHVASQATRGGILFFNPGAFGGGFVTGKRSVGLLELSETMSGEIVYL